MGDFNEEYEVVSKMFTDLGLITARNIGGTRFDNRQKKWSNIDHFLSTKLLTATTKLGNTSSSDHSPIKIEYEIEDLEHKKKMIARSTLRKEITIKELTQRL